MRTIKQVVSLTLAAALAACGGSSGTDGGGGTVLAAAGPQALSRFAAQVTFGDSLADVGSYAVSSIAAGGGGKFTINGDATAFHPELNGKTWTEMLAGQFGLPAPCAAQTGLQGAPNFGFLVPVVNHQGCYAYAQGNARISDPVGLNNAATGSPVGLLTVPVAAQVANHLAAVGGRFQGNEIVYVSAGMDELLALWHVLSVGANAAAQLAGPDPTAQAQARADYLFMTGSQAIATAATAGSDLADIVRSQIVAKGANFVVVDNVPDMVGTPLGKSEEPVLRSLIQAMVEGFNRSMKAGLDGEFRVAQVDIYALTHDQLFNPAFYAISNTTVPACGPNAFAGDALVCNVVNTLPGVDVSHFMFADAVHPTPYAHWLIARQVLAVMALRGWV